MPGGVALRRRKPAVGICHKRLVLFVPRKHVKATGQVVGYTVNQEKDGDRAEQPNFQIFLRDITALKKGMAGE